MWMMWGYENILENQICAEEEKGQLNFVAKLLVGLEIVPNLDRN